MLMKTYVEMMVCNRYDIWEEKKVWENYLGEETLTNLVSAGLKRP